MKLLPLLMLGAACGSMPHTRVQDVPDTIAAPPAGHATVVFVRVGTRGLGHKQPFFLADTAARFLGELPGNSRLHLTVPAGDHAFVGWFHTGLGAWGPATLVRASLREGQVAQIVVEPDHYGLELIAVPISKANCEQAPEWLAARRVAPDPSPDPSVLPPDKIREQVNKARSYFDGLDTKAKWRRTIDKIELGYSTFWGDRRPPRPVAIEACMQSQMIEGDMVRRMSQQK